MGIRRVRCSESLLNSPMRRRSPKKTHSRYPEQPSTSILTSQGPRTLLFKAVKTYDKASAAWYIYIYIYFFFFLCVCFVPGPLFAPPSRAMAESLKLGPCSGSPWYRAQGPSYALSEGSKQPKKTYLPKKYFSS